MANAWGLSWGNSWANSWAILAPIDNETKGGIPERDYKRYRKYLERLANLSSVKDIKPNIVKAAKAISSVPVSSIEIAKISEKSLDIDFEKLDAELKIIQNYLNRLERYNARVQMEYDDETVLLLLIN